MKRKGGPSQESRAKHFKMLNEQVPRYRLVREPARAAISASDSTASKNMTFGEIAARHEPALAMIASVLPTPSGLLLTSSMSPKKEFPGLRGQLPSSGPKSESAEPGGHKDGRGRNVNKTDTPARRVRSDSASLERRGSGSPHRGRGVPMYERPHAVRSSRCAVCGCSPCYQRAKPGRRLVC